MSNLPPTSALASALLAATAQPALWIYLIPRFRTFLANLELTAAQQEDGATKIAGVISCLNSAYYAHNSTIDNAFLVGSWAKGTRTRPPRDIDLYFLLPPAVYYRFEAYAPGVNRQSALLQEVKSKLTAKYGSSTIKGDGPVVLASFLSYSVEVVPAFRLDEVRSFYACDTKDGGSYMTTKPLHDIDAIAAADQRNAGNVRPLIRMLKAWQAWCGVPLKSFYLELLAIDFMDQCAWKNQGLLYYDWICRDFFKWMVSRAGTYVVHPGTHEVTLIGDAWKSRAESAYARADKAADLERVNKMVEAGDEWQKIFGPQVPRTV